jgi:hypothetical protein
MIFDAGLGVRGDEGKASPGGTRRHGAAKSAGARPYAALLSDQMGGSEIFRKYLKSHDEAVRAALHAMMPHG